MSVSHIEVPPVQVTSTPIDLNLYVGHWFEIERYNSWFEWANTTDNTAEYTLHGDSVRVVNRCKSASWWLPSKAEGVAVVGPEHNNAKLKVQFSKLLPWADYWILGVGASVAADAPYPWAVVGTPDRRFLWILSRTPNMPESALKLARWCAREQHYDLGKLVHVRHTA